MGAALLDDDAEIRGCRSPVREPEGYVRVHSLSEVESGRKSAGVDVRGDSSWRPLERGCL